MNLTTQDIDTLERWWIQKSRKNFLAYRKFVRCGNFLENWFVTDLCSQLQQFYVDYKAGRRPILILNTPPQHGKSWSVNDFISWIVGIDPSLKVIFASFSDNLGVRCNTYLQRVFDHRKYKLIFPDFTPAQRGFKDNGKRTSNLIEFWRNEGEEGYFRNTTVGGSITGETLDIGVIDDPVKGRAEANSVTVSEKIWDWFNDDFRTRFSDKAGLIVIQTRWSTTDLTGRMIENMENVKILNYPAIATHDEEHRLCGEPLFPDQKSLEFLLDRKATMSPAYWEALYQGNPTITGGNKFKDSWWKWWEVLPRIKYKFIVADTAQKVKTNNDWTVFQCWGYGIDDNVYLLDKFRAKLEAPELRLHAEMFYKKHDTPRVNLTDPVLRGMYIEDKSSGIGLLQELRKKKLKVFEVPRTTDKVFRAEDVSPYVEAGKVYLNSDIDGISNLTKEGREFPNSEYDDDLDTLMTAVEISFINKSSSNSLLAAMEAD